MTDLETRLTNGLAGTATRAPRPPDLAAGARVRLRRRRRTASVVALAAAAVVAVPVGVNALLGGPDTDRGRSASDLPAGWRTETWRDLAVGVPPTWAASIPWCRDGQGTDASAPVVGRPLPEARVACRPAYGYGVHFTTPSSGELPPGTEGTVQQYQGRRGFPDGAWIAYVGTRNAAVWVVTDQARLTRRVLDTVDPVVETDPNGCAGRARQATASRAEGLSVCRYAADGWLEQSELLPPGESAPAEAAIEDAASALGVAPACPASYPATPVVTMSGAGASARLYRSRECGIAGVFSDGTGTGALVDKDVLYWALSPGWRGSLPPEVPLPEPLRGQ